MTTPNGNIIFNADEGSDTQASGLGPATALYGSTASITNSSNVVTGIDTTGVTVGDLLWVQSSSGLQFNIIASVDSSSQVTCDNLYQVTETGRTWAIGGKRQTIDNSDSRRLLGEFNVQDLPAWAWVELETDQTVTSHIQGRGSRRIKSSEGSKKKITFDFVAADGEPCLSGGGIFQSLIFETVYSNLTFGRASTNGYQSHNQSYFYDCVLKNFFAFGVGFSRLFTAYFYRCRVEDVYIRNSVYNFTPNHINGANCDMYVESCLFKNCGIFNDSRSVLENSIFIGSGNHEFCTGTAPRVRNSIIYNYTNAVTGTDNQYQNVAYQRLYSDSTFQGNIFHTISSDLINLSSSSLEVYRFEVLDNLFYNVNQFCNISGVEELISDNNVTLLGDPFVDIANEDFNLNEAGNAGNLARHRKVDMAASTDERSISLSAPVGLGDEVLWLCPTFDSETLDLSGNGNHGTYNGGMGTVVDTSNGGSRAYSFDGVDDRVDFGDILDTEVWTSGRWTVSQWIYPQNSQYNWFLGKYINSSQQQFIINARDQGNGLRGGAVIYGSLTSQVWRGFEGTTNLNLNQWYHLVVEYDSSQAADDQVRIWLDGTEETINIWASSGTVSNIQDGSQTLRLNGLINGNSTFHKPSKQDDIRVFDRALTEQEIGHISKYRGITGSPITYEGLGGEVLWLCPTLHNSPRDLSGNDHHGTYNGGMSTVEDTDEGGLRAYSFDGSDDYIRIGSRTNFNFLVQTNYWSMSAWVYHSDLSQQRTVIGGDADNSQHGVSIIESSYNGLGYRGFRAYGSLSAYSPDTRSNATYTTGVWKHICWVVSGSSSKIYIDGVEEASESASFPTTGNSLTDDVMIGAYSSGSSRYAFMAGLIDDIRIYEKPLIVQEIAHLASKRGVLGRPQ
jgi:hypothetical protein